MTPAQLTALKADIQANHAAAWAAGQVNVIAEAYNAVASPDFYVWRTSISPAEVKQNTVWTELIALSQGARDTYRFLMEGSINAADANVRAAFAAIFSAGDTLDNLTALAMRKVNVVERMFATGTGSVGDPGLLVFEGSISGSTVYEAMSNG